MAARCRTSVTLYRVHAREHTVPVNDRRLFRAHVSSFDQPTHTRFEVLLALSVKKSSQQRHPSVPTFARGQLHS
jgi:hypothetical protein